MGSEPQQKYIIRSSVYLEYKAQRDGSERNDQNHLEWIQEVPSQFCVLVGNLAHATSAKIDLAQHTPTRFVAVMKVFKPSKGQEANTELAIFNAVSSSPFLLHCLDAFVGQFNRILLLEYAPFGNLDLLTRALKGLGHDTMRQYAKEMALALEFLHSHHIIHGDVKPENVLILASGHVVLADFNRSYRMTSDAPTTRDICGTFLTRPPEVWDRIPYDQSVDVWMYGVSLYNIASNKLLGGGCSIGESLMEKTRGTWAIEEGRANMNPVLQYHDERAWMCPVWPFLHFCTARHIAAIKAGQVTYIQPFFSTDLISLIQRTIQVESWARISTEQIVGHDYFTSLGQSDSDEVPLSPSYLHSILMTSPTERDIIGDILHQGKPTLDTQYQDTPFLDPQPQETRTLDPQPLVNEDTPSVGSGSYRSRS